MSVNQVPLGNWQAFHLQVLASVIARVCAITAKFMKVMLKDWRVKEVKNVPIEPSSFLVFIRK
jgi:hypothetical protein